MLRSASSEVRQRVKGLIHRRAVRAAQGALARDSAGPAWLSDEMFDVLADEYPVRQPWVPPTVEVQRPDAARARAVAAHLRRRQRKVLEIGGGFGHVSWGMAELGREVTCLDLTDPLLPQAAAAGVRGISGDACALPFDADTFDAAWSLNAFEHIRSPDKALAEAWRVVRPGGHVHLNFSPLYDAPLGLHAFFEIGVPFCQHLWTDEQLRARVTDPNLWHLNRWSLVQYRALWASFADRLHPVHFSEEHDLRGLELIPRFPSCFAKRGRMLEAFTVSKYVVTFEVRKPGRAGAERWTSALSLRYAEDLSDRTSE